MMGNKFYMMGVCGMGMAPLAAFLKDGGADVEGFDHSPNFDIKSALEKCGIEFSEPRMLDADRQVVISTALARKIGEIRAITGCSSIMKRGECWAKICAARRLTAIVGSHGKSTVSAMAAHAAIKLGLNCGYLVGAVPVDFPMHRYCGEGGIVISEIDESDGTIENFRPEITVALNSDLDHTDTYGDAAHMEKMFLRLFMRTKKMVVYPKRNAVLARIASLSGTPSRAVDTPEDFMGANRAMALAAIEESFASFPGISVFDDYRGLLRRQEVLCDTRKIAAVADYAHHPNELASFLKWFFKKYKGEKIVAFQPHRYTRTRRFASEFAEVLESRADGASIFVLPVYAASELPDPLGESSAITSKSRRIKLADPSDFFNMLSDKLNDPKAGKLNVAVIGAGDFYFSAKNFFNSIK